MSYESEAAELLGIDIGAYASASRTGDALDTAQLGLTLEWTYLAVDLSHGIQKTHWRVPSEPTWEMNEWQSGSAIGVRIYPFNTETIRPLLVWTHVSDIPRGDPFNEDEEPTSDYFGVGATFVFKRLELDVTYGAFGRECRFTSCSNGSKTNEFQFTLRGYFWK